MTTAGTSRRVPVMKTAFGSSPAEVWDRLLTDAGGVFEPASGWSDGPVELEDLLGIDEPWAAPAGTQPGLEAFAATDTSSGLDDVDTDPFDDVDPVTGEGYDRPGVAAGSTVAGDDDVASFRADHEWESTDWFPSGADDGAAGVTPPVAPLGEDLWEPGSPDRAGFDADPVEPFQPLDELDDGF